MKLATAFHFALALFAVSPVIACSSAEQSDVGTSSDEAALTATARQYIGEYRWAEGTKYLDFTQLTLNDGRGTWGRYEAMVDVGITQVRIMCLRAPCTSHESGRWRLSQSRGKYTLHIRPDSGAERAYGVSQGPNGSFRLSRGGDYGYLAPYTNPCALLDCQPGFICRDDNGEGVCEPSDPCMTVRCAADTHCEANPNGGAGCVPNVNPCAAMLCAANTECVVENGQGVCKPLAQNNCRKTGCSGNICADHDVFSTCIFRPEYACYQSAICERGSDGNCGFRQTATLTSCLANGGNNP